MENKTNCSRTVLYLLHKHVLVMNMYEMITWNEYFCRIAF